MGVGDWESDSTPAEKTTAATNICMNSDNVTEQYTVLIIHDIFRGSSRIR